MAAKTTAQAGILEIPPLEIKTVRLRIVGESPLMTHKWSEKATRQMEDDQQQKARQRKAAKVPEQEFQAAIYRLPDGTAGLPAAAFKKAIVTAATHVDGITKTFLRTAFHVIGAAVVPVNGKAGELRPTDLVRIDGSDPVMRTDMVRIGTMTKTADVRYRPEWAEWACDVTVRYNARSLSLEQLVHLFNLAGFGVGVGEWRPERDGMHGLFHVESVEEVG